MLKVEVAYCGKQDQKLLELEVENNSTILDIILQSRILNFFSEINLQQIQVGVWGQIKQLSDQVTYGDRIEIYRPLLKDPKQARLDRILLKE